MTFRAILIWLLCAGAALAQAPGNGGVTPPAQIPPTAVNVTQYGARADTLAYTDGTVAASSTAFSSASATFTAGDVGKLIQVQYAGAAGALLSTTIAAFVDAHDVTLTAPATIATPTVNVAAVVPATAQSGAGSYAPADTVAPTGGTTVTTAAAFTVATPKLVSATVNAAGSGGTPGACTLTGTTGTGTKFQIAATISGGGSISALGSISVAGSYTVNPTSLAAEPVTTSCSLVGSPTLTLKMGAATLTITNAGLYGALPSNPVATTSGGSGTGLTLTLTSATAGGQFSYGTDNATAIGNAITAAQTAAVPLYIPAPKSTGGACYGYTPPLTISANLSVVGDWVAGNWNNNINIPSGSPAVLGSVLCPTANGSDAIDASGTSLTVNLADIGILFQTTFGQSSTTTGDGFHYVATTTQGLSGSTWRNVFIYGHDGSHYAINLGNAIYNKYYGLSLYGGGLLKSAGNGITGNYGDSSFYGMVGMVLVGGSANGVDLSSTSTQNNNFLSFYAPEVSLVNQAGVTPVANPPTNAQLVYNIDTNTANIRMIRPTCGGNISGQAAQLNSLNDNVYDFRAVAWNCVVKANAWTNTGIASPSGNPGAYTDSTSSGTVAVIAGSSVQRVTVNASNAMTATNLASLYVPLPIRGTNVSGSGTRSIYATGSILSLGDLSAQGGLFVTGAGVQLNKSSNFAVEIGDGNTTSSVTVGNNNNLVSLGGATLATNATTGFPMIPTMAGTPTGTVAVTAGMAAIVIDTTNKKICYSTGGGTWECTGALLP